jgi:hypothetical protein
MSKSSKNKKEKVKKISEEEYAKYVSSLKGEGQVCVENKMQPNTERNETLKS